MKIKSCEISRFGKLTDMTVVPDSGITVIRGNNETGKSTLSAFIKFVLYGFSGRGRDEKNNEKLKYSPYDGTSACGAVVLESSDGEIYRVERSSDPKNPTVRILNSMGSEIFSGTEPGEALFGIDSVTFSKSVFVGQNDIEGSGMKDLGSGLEKLVLDSDGSESFDNARKTLVSERNELYNKMRSTGLVFELAEKLDSLKNRREKQADDNIKLVSTRHIALETEEKINKNKAHLEELYHEEENINAYEAHTP